MKNRWFVLPVAGIALATAGVLALVAPASAVLPGEAVGLLDQQVRSGDPTLAYVDQFNLDADTVRFAGETDDSRFWVGLGTDGKVCLIAVVGQPETGGAACAPADVVERSGAMMGLTPVKESRAAEVIVYLVPDSVNVDDVRGPWERVGTNVLVADAAEARAADVVSLARADGTRLDLVP